MTAARAITRANVRIETLLDVSSRMYGRGSFVDNGVEAAVTSVAWHRYRAVPSSLGRRVLARTRSRSASTAAASPSLLRGGSPAPTRRNQASFQKNRHSAWQPPWAAPSQRKSSRKTVFGTRRLWSVLLIVSHTFSARVDQP